MFFFAGSRRRRFSHITQIKQERRTVLGVELVYRLCEVRRAGVRSYAISIWGNGESGTCPFGADRRAAVDIFYAIVEGGVTPCTLAYIAEDFAVARGK